MLDSAFNPLFKHDALVARFAQDFPKGLPKMMAVLTITPNGNGSGEDKIELSYGAEVTPDDTQTPEELTAKWGLQTPHYGQIYDGLMQVGEKFSSHALNFVLINAPAELPGKEFTFRVHFPAIEPGAKTFPPHYHKPDRL